MRMIGSFVVGLASAVLLAGAGTLVVAQEEGVDGALATDGPVIGQAIELDALAEAWSSGDAD